MQLTSPEYFILLALVFFAYWFARRTGKLAVAIVLGANYFFYAKWHPIYLGIIPLAATCDFFLGRALGASKSRPGRRFLVTLSILLNCTPHSHLPLRAVPARPVRRRPPRRLQLGMAAAAEPLLLRLPGDDLHHRHLSRRRHRQQRPLLSYLASVSFFPTIVAGPITRCLQAAPADRKRRLCASRL
jgi:alginate O-acetyltransferase complex protein AlgI